jgi:nucleoside-diphosphate-sugar epimerase
MVYGPRDTEFLRVFKLARRGLGAVFGDGTQELCAVYAADLAAALTAVGEGEATIGRTYYACNAQRFTSRDFVRAVGHALGKEPKIVPIPSGLARAILRLTGAAARLAGRASVLNADKANEFLQPAWTADPAGLTRDTGWRAAHDLAAGLAATTAWYRDRGWL